MSRQCRWRLATVGLLLALGLAAAGCGKQSQPQGVTYTAAVDEHGADVRPGEAAGEPGETPGEPPAAPAATTAGQGVAGVSGEWPLYGQNYKAWRYSPLTQITKANVSRLRPAWSLNTGMHDAFETTPLVTGGTMYITTPWNHVLALDPVTGAQKWRFAWPLPTSLPLCCGAVNRGACVGSGKVVFGTLDAHLVALDAATGKQAWAVELADYKQGYSMTMAPQLVGDTVIAGISGGDFGVRGFVDAYNIKTGARLWRFWTVGPGNQYRNSWGGTRGSTAAGRCG